MLALDVACFLVDHPQERGWVRRGKRLERSDVENVDRPCQGSTNKMERASSEGSEQAPVAMSEREADLLWCRDEKMPSPSKLERELRLMVVRKRVVDDGDQRLPCSERGQDRSGAWRVLRGCIGVSLKVEMRGGRERGGKPTSMRDHQLDIVVQLFDPVAEVKQLDLNAFSFDAVLRGMPACGQGGPAILENQLREALSAEGEQGRA